MYSRIAKSPAPLKGMVSAQIERLSGLNFRWLTFPRELEDRFEADTSERRSARLALEGLLAIALFDLLLFMDRGGASADFVRALALRLGVITPLALGVIYLILRRGGAMLRESSIALVACLAGLVHLYLESGQTAVAFAFAQFGILAVILFANASMRLRFPYALAATGIMILEDMIFLRRDMLLRHDEKVLGMCLMLGTGAITLMANYSANREERLNYLLYLRGDVLVQDLSRSRDRLTRIAETDSLTGLANRHAFERKLKRLWRMAHLQGTALSIIVVDVDRFKRMNDTFGHLYGDKVLKRIARLLTEALRQKDDFAARVGGEEFVILLPGAHRASAAMVAERLRMLVEVAGFPPPDNSDVPLAEISATVSCGVATAYPMARTGSQELLHAADKAMYAAKSRGRNKVCCAPEESAPAGPTTRRETYSI